MNTPSRIIGLDPGLQAMGWGVIAQKGAQLSYVACGTLRPATDDALAQRLLKLDMALTEILAQYRPTMAALEDSFVSQNSATSLKLGQACAVGLLACARAGLDVRSYAPTHIKKALTGNGRAQKAQLQHMVRLLLPRATPSGSHAADALGVAIAHAHTHTHAQSHAHTHMDYSRKVAS